MLHVAPMIRHEGMTTLAAAPDRAYLDRTRMLDDRQVLAVRAAIAARVTGEAAARGAPLTLFGTGDDEGPTHLSLWLIADGAQVERRLDGDAWGNVSELRDALGPWLGELPWGERDMTWYRAPIVHATPGGEPTWSPLRSPWLDRWRALPELPPRIRTLQQQADAAEVLRDALLEELPEADAMTLARAWLGANAQLVPRTGLRFANGIPVEVDLYLQASDVIDREMPLPWSARPRVRFLAESRVEVWPALAAARIDQ
jgi:hypothetical protein